MRSKHDFFPVLRICTLLQYNEITDGICYHLICIGSNFFFDKFPYFCLVSRNAPELRQILKKFFISHNYPPEQIPEIRSHYLCNFKALN